MSAISQQLESLRPTKVRPSPWSTPKVLRSVEPDGLGGEVETTTVFLTGAECPFRCTMCDLWQFTSIGNTPLGAIPFQLSQVLPVDSAHPRQWLKLYNASNFFDHRSVPKQDLESIADYCSTFERVIVENHPRLCDERMTAFADSLRGNPVCGKLEVAMGLETIHPNAIAAMNKGMTLDDFDRAVERCNQMGIDVRVFVLLHPPGVPIQESVEWTCRTIEYAMDRSVRHISIIPVRAGNGWIDRLVSSGEYQLPTIGMLREFSQALRSDLRFQKGSVIEIDMWDWDQIAGGCSKCREFLEQCIGRFNRTLDFQSLANAETVCECDV